MHKKIILRVMLVCEGPMDNEDSKKIQRYFFPYQDAIPIYIEHPVKNNKVTIIYPPNYKPIADMPMNILLTSKKGLYSTLAHFIYYAIEYLNEIHYPKSDAVLTITIPRITRYHRVYEFGWTLDY